MYATKGVPIYLVYYNSRIPNVKISKSMIKKQHILNVESMVGNHPSPLAFEMPLLLREYSKEIRTNSILIYIDLAGSYMGRENAL